MHGFDVRPFLLLQYHNMVYSRRNAHSTMKANTPVAYSAPTTALDVEYKNVRTILEWKIILKLRHS